MADKDKSTAELAQADVEAIGKAAAGATATEGTPVKGEREAHVAELARQQAVADAVAKAGDKDLPKLGGPLKEPGLGA